MDEETHALMMVAAGVLPAFGNRGGVLLLLSLATVALIAVLSGSCMALDKFTIGAGIGCFIGILAGGVVGVASLALGLVRWRYRVRGAESMLGKPVVAGIGLYAMAIAGFFGLISIMT